MVSACCSRRFRRRNSTRPTIANPLSRAWASRVCDDHANGHTAAQFHLSPDGRPQERRFRLDTVSLRGLFNQQIHGSKRSLRSVEDFTEFEQRTAYFNGAPIRPMKKGFQEIPRVN